MAKLKDYCLNITDGEHSSVENDINGEYYLLSNKNIVDNSIVVLDNDRKISFDTWYNINKRTKLENGDVLISTVGTLGKTAIIKNKIINYTFQRSVGIIKCNHNKLINKFLYYYLNLKHIQNKLTNTAKGAVQKCIFINDLKNLNIDIPTITNQQKIANVLSSLDDKIELNNKINKELEQMAKDLYNYWFVQFDFPDENKRPYKSSGGKMVYNDMLKREIPVGWEVEKLNKYITIGSGFPFNSKDYLSNGKCKIITIKNVQNGYLDLSTVETITDIPEKIPEFAKLKIGDVLISLTGNIGRMCFVDSCNLLLNQRVGKLLTSEDFLNFAFLFLSNREQQTRLKKISNGSSQKILVLSKPLILVLLVHQKNF